MDLFGSKTRCAGSASFHAASLELRLSSISVSSAALWLDVLSVYMQLRMSLMVTERRHIEVKVETLYAGDPG